MVCANTKDGRQAQENKWVSEEENNYYSRCLGGGGGGRDGSVNLDGKTPVGVSKDISWKNETWQCWYCVYIFSRQGSDNFQVCIR